MTEPEAAAVVVDRGRRTFGPVVLLGLLAAALTAVAGSKPWAAGSGRAAAGVAVAATGLDRDTMPAANALALVCLACWGVVLVARGRWRRAVSVLAVLAAAGTVATVVVGFGSVPDGVREAFAQLGTSGVDVRRTGWFWVSAVSAVLDLVAAVLAVRWVGRWPEMGAKYDAPTGAPVPQEETPLEDLESIDLWRAMDDGRDPTA